MKENANGNANIDEVNTCSLHPTAQEIHNRYEE